MERPFTFAQRLKTLIDDKGLSKSEIAKACNIDRSNITRYLNGEYEAKQDVVYRISQRYGVNEAWLMGYDVPIDIPDIETLRKQHEEINEIFDRMPSDLRVHAIALLRGLAQQSQSTDNREGSD